MPIERIDNFIDVYRVKASASDENELSGRSGRANLTKHISQNIIDIMDLQEIDHLVDIGCGDGSLLTMSSKICRELTGILPTEEEVDRVRAIVANTHIDVKIGLVQNTNLQSHSYDKVICNGVFLVIKSDSYGESLLELSRIAKNDALVFVGEVLRTPLEHGFGNSILGWLWFTLRKRGVRIFAKNTSRVVKAALGSEVFVVSPKDNSFMAVEGFLKLATQSGLELLKYWPHEEVNNEGGKYLSPDRINYLFRKKSTNKT